MVRLALVLLALCVATAVAAQPAAKNANRPAWAELTADQQMILAPLKQDWENLDPESRRKWVGIAKRYPKMKTEQQERVQRRMQHWAALTPVQRRQARENYRRIAKQRAEKRQLLSERWAEYQALPPHERQYHVPPSDQQPR